MSRWPECRTEGCTALVPPYLTDTGLCWGHSIEVIPEEERRIRAAHYIGENRGEMREEFENEQTD